MTEAVLPEATLREKVAELRARICKHCAACEWEAAEAAEDQCVTFLDIYSDALKQSREECKLLSVCDAAKAANTIDVSLRLVKNLGKRLASKAVRDLNERVTGLLRTTCSEAGRLQEQIDKAVRTGQWKRAKTLKAQKASLEASGRRTVDGAYEKACRQGVSVADLHSLMDAINAALPHTARTLPAKHRSEDSLGSQGPAYSRDGDLVQVPSIPSISSADMEQSIARLKFAP